MQANWNGGARWPRWRARSDSLRPAPARLRLLILPGVNLLTLVLFSLVTPDDMARMNIGAFVTPSTMEG